MNAEIEAYLQELVQEIAADKGFTVHLFECGERDHVHCFVSAPPKLSITAIVKYLKGITGRNTLRKLVEWKKLPVLKVGRKVLIKTDMLELFMEANEGRDLRDKGNVKAVTRNGST